MFNKHCRRSQRSQRSQRELDTQGDSFRKALRDTNVRINNQKMLDDTVEDVQNRGCGFWIASRLELDIKQSLRKFVGSSKKPISNDNLSKNSIILYSKLGIPCEEPWEVMMLLEDKRIAYLTGQISSDHVDEPDDVSNSLDSPDFAHGGHFALYVSDDLHSIVHNAMSESQYNRYIANTVPASYENVCHISAKDVFSVDGFINQFFNSWFDEVYYFPRVDI